MSSDTIQWALELMQRPGGKVQVETLEQVITGRLRAIKSEDSQVMLVVGDCDINISDIIVLTSAS